MEQSTPLREQGVSREFLKTSLPLPTHRLSSQNVDTLQVSPVDEKLNLLFLEGMHPLFGMEGWNSMESG